MVMAVPRLIRFSTPWQSLLLALLNYAMVILLAITLAYWSWQFLQPDPVSAPPVASTPSQSFSNAINAAEWFGNSSSDGSATASLDLKLVGIFGALNSASTKHPGFAIFQMNNGKQVHAMLNQEFTPGLKLTNIGRDNVTILQNGIPQNILLDEKSRPLEIARIRSTAPKAETKEDNTFNEKKVRQIRIMGDKPKPASGPAEPVKTTPAEQPSAQAHIAEAPSPRQNMDDLKYLPVEKPEPGSEEKHEGPAASQAKIEGKNESQPAISEETHTEKKGLLDLLNNLKNWVTGKKPEEQ